MPGAYQRDERCAPFLPRRFLGCNLCLDELRERQAQAPGARIGRERIQQLELVQAAAQSERARPRLRGSASCASGPTSAALQRPV